MQTGTLAQLGAKNGEKFIWVEGDDSGVFTVINDSDDFGGVPHVSAESESYGKGLFKDEIFRRVSEGPVRTVTRREIVPGTYGRVVVGKTYDTGIWFEIADDEKGALILTAEELDNVAMIASQLAEALRDG